MSNHPEVKFVNPNEFESPSQGDIEALLETSKPSTSYFQSPEDGGIRIVTNPSFMRSQKRLIIASGMPPFPWYRKIKILPFGDDDKPTPIATTYEITKQGDGLKISKTNESKPDADEILHDFENSDDVFETWRQHVAESEQSEELQEQLGLRVVSKQEVIDLIEAFKFFNQDSRGNDKTE